MNENLNYNTQDYQVGDKDVGADWHASLQSVFRRRWFILTAVTAVFCLSVLILSRFPDVYTASTSVLVDRVDEDANNYKEILLPMSEQGASYYETKVALLKSYPILEKTAAELNLVEHYKEQGYKVINNQGAVGVLSRKISAHVMGRTQIIKVSVEDQNPEMAAKISDAVSNIFVREQWRERFFVSDQLLQWFPDEAETLQQNSTIEQLQKLDTNKMDVNELSAYLPSVMKDSVLNTMKQDRMKIDAELEELSKRYTQEHPKMKELNARAGYLEQEFDIQVQKIVKGLKAGLSGQFSVNNIKVIENAIAPTDPTSPKRFLIVVTATFLSLILCIWISIFMEYLNRSIRTEDDIKSLGISFFGYLPLLKDLAKSEERSKITDLLHSDIRLNDDLTAVRVNLLFSTPADLGKLIMCTSSIPGEGKTTVAAMLASSLADSGLKVLLVDADMRKSTVHQVFKLDGYQNGLSSCLTGAAQAKDVIQVMDSNPLLHVMPSGKRPTNPVILLGSKTMDNLIAELSEDYDKIIFDMPPVLHIPDAMFLAEKMHVALIVFQEGKIHSKIGKQIVAKVGNRKNILVGSVINQAELEKHGYQAYQYYHKYHKYYSSSAS